MWVAFQRKSAVRGSRWEQLLDREKFGLAGLGANFLFLALGDIARDVEGLAGINLAGVLNLVSIGLVQQRP
ncbi:hypothetical protein SAMN05660860_00615 [Geoalkalibacter ferrihydriticus]|uniref:Uncharacterized protein n=1 Tax=Geoalkalibacter ferrihydriticus TaxID=392333 RepID=A0A1G9K0E6_9BACT|nr:hypothetical protein SAMN05660860_00615 [Geoalkalibacter ferrihydriticus]